MTKQQIEALALEYAKSKSKNETYQMYLKEAYIEGLKKASELLYS